MAINLFKFLGPRPKKKKDSGKKGETGVSPMEMGGVPSGNASTPAEKLAEGMLNVRDIIAPAAIEVDFNHVQIGNTYYRTIFVSGYPRFVGANWLSPVINFEHTLDISMFYYPVKSKMILDDLRRKITELEATVMTTRERGRILDPVVTAALEDAKSLQEQLVKGVEKYFQFSFYITIPADSLEELESVTSRLESTLGSLLLISKTAALQMEQAFQSSIPAGMDKLMITRNMDTTSLATTFPFTSSDLTMEEGIMYGINRHNGSLVIFDRFSLENANTVVFAKSGAGKSYMIKLEALRLMIFGAEVMIIDPEEEYRPLCEVVGGDYIDFSASSPSMINPFDLSGVAVEGENELGQKILSLHTLFKLMLGDLNPTEEAILDRALIETYRLKGITTDPDTQVSREPPVMEDLYKVLLGGDEPESRNMAERLEKFIKGSMAGIFDRQSTIDIKSMMTVFSTKNLEEALRPIAFYIILDFIWTRIKSDLKKRILIVEEAWYLMQNEDSARFIYGIAKRARKYYLGLTTISQDVDDFLTSEYGKAIVTNSSIQVLLKQHPAAIDKVADTFYLSEGEKRLLLAADIGEGLFFAGSNHVAIKVMASEAEHNLVTTNPEELLKLRQQGMISEKKPATQPARQTYKPYNPQPSDEYKTMDKFGKPKAGYGGFTGIKDEDKGGRPKPPQPSVSAPAKPPSPPASPPSVPPTPSGGPSQTPPPPKPGPLKPPPLPSDSKSGEQKPEGQPQPGKPSSVPVGGPPNPPGPPEPPGAPAEGEPPQPAGSTPKPSDPDQSQMKPQPIGMGPTRIGPDKPGKSPGSSQPSKPMGGESKQMDDAPGKPKEQEPPKPLTPPPLNTPTKPLQPSQMPPPKPPAESPGPKSPEPVWLKEPKKPTPPPVPKTDDKKDSDVGFSPKSQFPKPPEREPKVDSMQDRDKEGEGRGKPEPTPESKPPEPAPAKPKTYEIKQMEEEKKGFDPGSIFKSVKNLFGGGSKEKEEGTIDLDKQGDENGPKPLQPGTNAVKR